MRQVDIARALGITPQAVHSRLRSGWTIERLVEEVARGDSPTRLAYVAALERHRKAVQRANLAASTALVTGAELESAWTAYLESKS